MFYCDFCRAALDWPRSVGWPWMGVSTGPCEECGKVTTCHDVPSASLPPGRTDLVMKHCPECGERRWAKSDDYLCVFCRGEVELPDPEGELREHDKQMKIRLNKMLSDKGLEELF